jgi:hypothetical protein
VDKVQIAGGVLSERSDVEGRATRVPAELTTFSGALLLAGMADFEEDPRGAVAWRDADSRAAAAQQCPAFPVIEQQTWRQTADRL